MSVAVFPALTQSCTGMQSREIRTATSFRDKKWTVAKITAEM